MFKQLDTDDSRRAIANWREAHHRYAMATATASLEAAKREAESQLETTGEQLLKVMDELQAVKAAAATASREAAESHAAIDQARPNPNPNPNPNWLNPMPRSIRRGSTRNKKAKND